MRRIPRLETTIDLLALSNRRSVRPNYLCSTCRASRASFSTSTARPSSTTDKWRKRIWGSEPPVPEDPYGAPGFIERQKQQQQAKRNERVEELEADIEADPAAARPGLKKPRSVGGRAARRARQFALGDDIVVEGYQPATTWDGLEEVGGKVEKPVLIFEGFLPATKITDPELLMGALYAAVTLTQAEIEQLHTDLKTAVHGVTSSEDDPSPPPEQSSLALEEAPAEDSPSPLSKFTPPKDDNSWLSTPLPLDTKLRIHITFTRLTGHLIPDPILTRASTVQEIAAHLLVPPKPKKLAEILLADEKLQELKNVKIYPRRVTAIDKEKMVGRWKVIERELVDRGLPVTGI